MSLRDVSTIEGLNALLEERGVSITRCCEAIEEYIRINR